MDSSLKSSGLEIEQESLIVSSEKCRKDNIQAKSFKITGLAIFLFILNVIGSSFMVITGKLGYFYNPNLNALDYMLIRGGAMIIGSIIPIIWNKESIKIRKENRISIGIALFFAFTSMLANFIGLKYLPTTKASLIMNLYPIVFNILGAIFLKEIVKLNEVMGMIGAFIGVIIMLINKSEGSNIEVSYYIQILSSLLVFYCGVSCSAIGLYIRVFTQTNSPLLYPFYYAVTLSSFSVLFFLVYPSLYNVEYYTLRDVVLFLISGLLNILSNMLSGYAFKLEEVNTLVPFGYIGNIIVFICDVFVFNYIFGFTDIFGAIVVIVCLLLKFRAVKYNKQQLSGTQQNEESH